jgi:hypothetical protein
VGERHLGFGLVRIGSERRGTVRLPELNAEPAEIPKSLTADFADDADVEQVRWPQRTQSAQKEKLKRRKRTKEPLINAD